MHVCDLFNTVRPRKETMASLPSCSLRPTLRQSQVKIMSRKHFWEQSIGSEQVGQGRGGGQERAHGKQHFAGGPASELSWPGAEEGKAFVSHTHHAALEGGTCQTLPAEQSIFQKQKVSGGG